MTDLVNCAWREEVGPMTKVVCEPNGDAACIPKAFMVIIMKHTTANISVLGTFFVSAIGALGWPPIYVPGHWRVQTCQKYDI